MSGNTEQTVRTREDVWFIKRHGAWFRPNAAGYCIELVGAGTFSKDRAKSYLDVDGIEIFHVSHPRIQSELLSLRAAYDRFWGDVLAPEAEVRGAAEQRRKDAEGQEPVAWAVPDLLPGDGYPWVDVILYNEKTTHNTLPLYTRPTNVAALEAEIEGLRITLAHSDGVRNEKQKRITALEARIAELEGVLSKLLDAIGCTGSTEEPDVLIAEGEARAALEREGGE